MLLEHSLNFPGSSFAFDTSAFSLLWVICLGEESLHHMVIRLGLLEMSSERDQIGRSHRWTQVY